LNALHAQIISAGEQRTAHRHALLAYVEMRKDAKSAAKHAQSALMHDATSSRVVFRDGTAAQYEVCLRIRRVLLK
jgi:hypothetical protein